MNLKEWYNKRWYSIPGLILAGAFLVFAFMMVNKSVEASHEFKVEKNKIAEILNFKDRLLSFRDWVFTETAWEEKRVKYEETLARADVHYQEALSIGYNLLIGCLIFMIVIILIYARKRIYFGITLGLATVGIALLFQGIMNPILEMGAFEEDMTFKIYVKPKDIPYYTDAMEMMRSAEDVGKNALGNFKIEEKIEEFIPDEWSEYTDGILGEFTESAEEVTGEVAEYVQPTLNTISGFMEENAEKEFGKDQVFKGRTYFYYQNKGIMDVITLLWNNNNKPVAAAIGTFSVIVPLIKLLFSIIILLFPITRAKTLRKVLSYISKWSMADVFVVGAFLAYLSFANMSPGVQMDANSLFGLYYFGGYVLVSIFLGIMLDLTIKEKIKHAETKEAIQLIKKRNAENKLEVGESNENENS
ncbi:MAG: paraquat-inducible protein A [Crocinitomicaceae bacterium]|nr:paraquat-inducible protein A [Crocinitomicaceae bacterium]